MKWKCKQCKKETQQWKDTNVCVNCVLDDHEASIQFLKHWRISHITSMYDK